MRIFPLAGVDIEIFEPPTEVGPRIEAAEDLNPQQLFGLYSDQQGLAPEAVATGFRILEGVAVGNAAGLQRSAVVNFGSVELEGYLSFRRVWEMHRSLEIYPQAQHACKGGIAFASLIFVARSLFQWTTPRLVDA